MALKLPIHVINKYLYNQAIAGTQEIHGVWNVKAFNTSLPNGITDGSRIVFLEVGKNMDQLITELRAANANTLYPSTYILYDTIYPPITGTMWALEKAQTIYYFITSPEQQQNLENVQYVKNYIFDLVKKFDESAQAINNSAQSDANIRFKYIRADQENADMDFRGDRSEDDRALSSLILTYEYTKS
jgi:hypothetical protein